MTTSSALRKPELLAVILASLLVSACGGSATSDPPATPPPSAPVISSFTATPTAMMVGGSSTLAWTVTGATSLSIDQSVGPVSGSSASVSPAATATYTLTATNPGGSATASATVTVSPVPVSTVTVTLASSNLYVGQTTPASVVLKDANGNTLAGRTVTWSSSSASVATVDASGLVTATGAGTAMITGTSEGRSGSSGVAVALVPVSTVTVTPPTSLHLGGPGTHAFATLRDVSGNALVGRAISWSSAASSVASIDVTGYVLPVGVGTTTITAISEGISGSALVTVARAPVATVSVSLAPSALYVDESSLATATLFDESGNVLAGRDVVWGTSNSGVASVDASGNVTAHGSGSALIAAASEGRSGAATLTVTQRAAVATVTVILGSPVVTVGEAKTASVLLQDANGNVLTASAYPLAWSSSNPSIAAVAATGSNPLVTAVGVGSATITASTGGKSGSATVQVNSAGPGAPTQMAAVSAIKQTSGLGQAALQPPAVLVRDASGMPVPGVNVDFSVTAGGGSLTGSPATTDSNGVARAASWILGVAGAQSVRGTSSAIGGASVDFSGQARASTDGFDTTLWLSGAMSDSQIRAFVNAKERIEEIVVGDLSPVVVNYSAATLASCGGQAVAGTIDDVLVVVEVGPIDGAGSILGQAGPCFIRSLGKLPLLGHMKFDSADIARLEADGRLDSVILHEMMHVIGFGTVWTDLALLAGSGTADPYFTGSGAGSSFLSYNDGNTYVGSPVPVENTGGTGTVNSHWRETVFKSELMTGWLSGTSQPFSRTTAASLADLGYTVDPTKADAYSILSALRAASADDGEPQVFLGDDVRLIPPIAVDDAGRPVGP